MDGVKLGSECAVSKAPWGNNAYKQWTWEKALVCEGSPKTWTRFNQIQLARTQDVLDDIDTPIIKDRNTEQDPVLGTIRVTAEQCEHEVGEYDVNEHDTGRVNGKINEMDYWPEGQSFVMSLAGGEGASAPGSAGCKQIELLGECKIRLVDESETASAPPRSAYAPNDPPSAASSSGLEVCEI